MTEHDRQRDELCRATVIALCDIIKVLVDDPDRADLDRAARCLSDLTNGPLWEQRLTWMREKRRVEQEPPET